MKILFASAEVDPFSKVGGLADVALETERALVALPDLPAADVLGRDVARAGVRAGRSRQVDHALAQ